MLWIERLVEVYGDSELSDARPSRLPMAGRSGVKRVF